MALPAGVKAINLGCGLSTAPGWVNIDNSPNARLSKLPLLRWTLWKLRIISDQRYSVKWPRTIEHHDLRKKLPYADCSIDYAYTSHFLEHLSATDARRLMGEVFRVLKPGGVLRVVVPDLALGARRYLDCLGSNGGGANAAEEFLNWLQLGKPEARDPHLWMYDAASLSAMLVGVGFTNAAVCEYRKGRVPDCDALDNRPEDSLHLEAEKPQPAQS